MGVIIYSFNMNISPKIVYGVLECDVATITELHAYDFVIKNFVMKKERYLCWTLYLASYSLSFLQFLGAKW